MLLLLVGSEMMYIDWRAHPCMTVFSKSLDDVNTPSFSSSSFLFDFFLFGKGGVWRVERSSIRKQLSIFLHA